MSTSRKRPATKRVAKRSGTKAAKSKAHATDVEHVYVLRCNASDLSSSHGFVWPKSGLVECSDWSPRAKCGNGLHGWLWGEGDITASGDRHSDPSAKWIVARVVKSELVDLVGKVKFPRAWVEFVGTREAAVTRMCELAGAGRQIIYGTATAGYAGTATAGYAGTATAGDEGTATAGYAGTATAGTRGTATAGYAGTATAGDEGTATAGDEGTATAGDAGTATAGENGALAIRWWDEASRRYRRAVGYVGEDGIEAGVAYVVRDGKLARKDGK